YIKKDLANEFGASTKGRPKPLANMDVVQDLLHFLWACDEYTFRHPRVRVQLSFSLLILAYLGLRPGEFAVSSMNRDTNEGLKYKDVCLYLVPWSDGQTKIVMSIKIRNRKNHRNNDAESPSFLLYEDLENPFLCPVSHFCALAFADNAFTNIESPADLRALQKQSLNDTDPSRIHIRESMLEIPILRSTSRAGRVSDGEILGTGSLNYLLRNLGQRAGYKDVLTSYCFRRGFANELIEAVTAAQRRQRMGHQSDDTIVYYISNTSGVDSQSIVLHREQNKNLINAVRSMRLGCKQEAPVPHGSLLTHSR
ncbi:hypothetical protein BDV97DRAFT_282815, partial [Delphinella strobiligena]